MNQSEDIVKLDYYKSKNIPKDPTMKDSPSIPDSNPENHLLESPPRPKTNKKSKYHQPTSKTNSAQNLPSPAHGSSFPRLNQANSKALPMSFGGNEFQEDINEFPEDLNKGMNSPGGGITQSQTHLKNLASYSNNEQQNYMSGFPANRPSLLSPSGHMIDNIEKKLEKINNDIMGDRESQKSLLSKLEALRLEKETLQKEMEKQKSGYEKRIESLKEDLGNINKLKLELEYKDQMYTNQRSFYEEELNRLEDEKSEIERNFNKIDNELRNLRNRGGIEEDLWKNKYERLLEDFAHHETDHKRAVNRIDELQAESLRKEENKQEMIIGYENRIKSMAQELFRNKPDSDLIAKLQAENQLLLSEMTETKLKMIQTERFSSDMSSLQRENEVLRLEIAGIEGKFNQKDSEIDALRQNLQNYEEKIRKGEGLEESLVLIAAENDRLMRVLAEFEGYSKGFVSKAEIQAEIDEIMRKFLRERELFEAQIEKLAEENRDLTKENMEIRLKGENLQGLIRENEMRSQVFEKNNTIEAENRMVSSQLKRISIENEENNAQNVRILSENERLLGENQRLLHENQRISSEKQQILFEKDRVLEEIDRKNREISEKELFMRKSGEISLMNQHSRLMGENDRGEIERLLAENQRILSENQRISSEKQQIFLEKGRFLEEIDRKNREIQEKELIIRRIGENNIRNPGYRPGEQEILGLQAKIVMINAENDRLFAIIEEKEAEIEELIKRQQPPSSISFPDENLRIFQENNQLHEEITRLRFLLDSKSPSVLQETRLLKENIPNEYLEGEIRKLQEKNTVLEGKNIGYLTEIDKLSSQTKKLTSEVEYWRIKHKSVENSQNLQLAQDLASKPQIYLEKEIEGIREKFSIDSDLIRQSKEEIKRLEAKLDEKTIELENLKKEHAKLQQEAKLKEEELMEIGLDSNSLEKSYGDLRIQLRNKEIELREKKDKLKDFEKRVEILEAENTKITKIFHSKLHEIEEITKKTQNTHEIEELRMTNEHLKRTNMALREEIMKLKSDKSNVENENFSLRQEIDNKNKEIKSHFELYKTERTEHENFLKQSEKALKEHGQFSYVKTSLEAENFSLRERNDMLQREIEEIARTRDHYQKQLEKTREKLLKQSYDITEEKFSTKKLKHSKEGFHTHEVSRGFSPKKHLHNMREKEAEFKSFSPQMFEKEFDQFQ